MEESLCGSSHSYRPGPGRAVKITASRRLDLRTIIFEDAPRKGLDIVGIVDAGSTLVAFEIEEMLATGELAEVRNGGLLHPTGS